MVNSSIEIPLADVILPLPLPRSFTYFIPSEFRHRLRKGSHVLVPFGKKLISGIVVDFPKTSPIASLKPIHDLLDAEPVISEELLVLSDWIARYYCTTRGEVVKALLPRGIASQSKRMVELIRTPTDEELKSLMRGNQKKGKIISALSSGQVTSVSSLQKKTGIKALYALLAGLQEDGIIKIAEKGPKAHSKIKVSKFVIKKSSLSLFHPRGKNQTHVLARLAEITTYPYPVQQLLKESRSTMSSLKSLAQKGIVEIIEREVERKNKSIYIEPMNPMPMTLTPWQLKALGAIKASLTSSAGKTFLLHGITGSGKTQVYIEAIRSVLALGKTAIVLVPEISLTPQIVQRFQNHFGDLVIVMHSRMSVGERYDVWRFTREGKYKIVIGPRSAIFAPVQNLGLIVVDEEHESSYKQFDATPRYNARDVAVVRAHHLNITVILGSATPSIESFYNAKTGKYSLLEMPERVDDAVLPSIKIVDMSAEHKQRYAEMKEQAKEIGRKAFQQGFHSISKLLEEKIQDRLNRKEGIILLQNRRGFAPFLECLDCGYVDHCSRCDVSLTYHLSKKHLRCHYCGSVKPVPDLCPKCGGIRLKLQGFGTQRVEQDLTALFPTARILRMDLDTTTQKGSHERLLLKFARGEADILMGTQMVAKGLDFPRVTLVGVISADTQMLLPDFRSAEKTFQLLTQVAGRAGRSALKGEVIIQSFQITHYALKHVMEHNYDGFYKEELRFRKEAVYPPYSRIALVEIQSINEKKAEQAANDFAIFFTRLVSRTAILGPTPAVIAKIKNRYRWHMIMKPSKDNDSNGKKMKDAIVQSAHYIEQRYRSGETKVIIDIDPQGIM